MSLSMAMQVYSSYRQYMSLSIMQAHILFTFLFIVEGGARHHYVYIRAKDVRKVQAIPLRHQLAVDGFRWSFLGNQSLERAAHLQLGLPYIVSRK